MLELLNIRLIYQCLIYIWGILCVDWDSICLCFLFDIRVRIWFLVIAVIKFVTTVFILIKFIIFWFVSSISWISSSVSVVSTSLISDLWKTVAKTRRTHDWKWILPLSVSCWINLAKRNKIETAEIIRVKVNKYL